MSYKTTYRSRNLAAGLCVYGQHHSKPLPGNKACEACNEINRVRMRTKQGCQPWIVSKKGRVPSYIKPKPTVEEKIAKLRIRIDKHQFWIDKLSSDIAKIELKGFKELMDQHL